MPRAKRVFLAAAVLAALPAIRPAAAAAGVCEPDGVQASGAIYRICMPASWNGDLVLYAHGYVGAGEPVAIPENQLSLPDGTSVPGIVNMLGFAFATTSYSTNGLAVLPAIDDIVDLVHIFNVAHRAPRHVYLTGVSEGGLITTLAVERHPEVFDGGLAACGPIGDFRQQVNYDGDFRVVFDYFFPGVLPPSPLDVPQEVMDHFFDTYVPAIQAAIQNDPDGTRQLLKVAHAPTDPMDPSTVEETITGLAWYVVFATNDATQKLGGQPYGNRLRYYFGSDNDPLLNMKIERATPDLGALGTIQRDYQTTGRLRSPLVTLHTTGDPIIPYWHEALYTFKTLFNGSFTRRVNVPVVRYGHCNFKASDALVAFAILLLMANQQQLTGVEAVLTDAPSMAEYRSLARQYGAIP